ncbi:YeeE/YedE family protein [uncultured Ramlibacter sp.]|uniref:YeeE/YedE family protein n=1 Tax=uncultured Ramlibacter sp. TaxID=260755 RepID=UPI00261629F2|nr:YeeE/YedE family protein [uncultured Ramlibacter sp.]
MTIDHLHFTPWLSLAGGLLIGLAAAAFILLSGRVLGISGIAGGLLRPLRGDVLWRLAFLAGVAAAPLAWSLFAPLPAARFDTGWPLLLLAGLLVGWGTRAGGGCTSGHGVCGLSRLSPRSLAATLCFMATGFATVFVIRHLLA